QQADLIIPGGAGPAHQAIVLEHIKVTAPGGGKPSGDPPEGAALKGGVEYTPRYITPLPAYAAFVRHANGVEFHDVKVMFGGAEGGAASVGISQYEEPGVVATNETCVRYVCPWAQ